MIKRILAGCFMFFALAAAIGGLMVVGIVVLIARGVRSEPSTVRTVPPAAVSHAKPRPTPEPTVPPPAPSPLVAVAPAPAPAAPPAAKAEDPPPAAAAPEHEDKTPKSSGHAKSLLAAADNLKLDNPDAALEFLRQAVIEHPYSIEADQAKKRIVALKGRIPAPSEYRLKGEPVVDRKPSPRKPPGNNTPPLPLFEYMMGATAAAQSASNRGGGTMGGGPVGRCMMGHGPIMTGPRGGQYYINSNGNKTYVDR